MNIDYFDYHEDDPCPRCGSTDIECIDADGVVFYDEDGEITGDEDWIEYRCNNCGAILRESWTG